MRVHDDDGTRLMAARPWVVVLPVPALALGAACLTAGFLPRLVADALAGEACELQPVGHLSRACEAGNGAMVRWVGPAQRSHCRHGSPMTLPLTQENRV